MPLIWLLRAVLTLLSLCVVALGLLYLWSWASGQTALLDDRTVFWFREDWKLAAGLALLAFSSFGRYLILPLLARETPPSEGAAAHQRQLGHSVRSLIGDDLAVYSSGPDHAPVLIFTHGWDLDHTEWAPFVSALSSRYRIITWDLPGLGASRASQRSMTNLEEFASGLARVIDWAGQRPVVLVGHSIGGMTVQTLAREYPERFVRDIAGVVLLNTTHTNPLQTMALSGLAQALRWPVIEPLMRATIVLAPLIWLSSQLSYWNGTAHISERIGFGLHVTREQLDRVTRLTTAASPDISARGQLAMFRWDWAEALAQHATPLLVIAGDLDLVTLPSASRHIADRCKGADLKLVSGAGHFGPVEATGVYAALLQDFIDRHCTGRGREQEGRTSR